jgi:hypothetical protein
LRFFRSHVLTLLGIGGEYPAGSVGCAESTGELREGTRNKWFILFTNVQIDFAFLVAAIVATVVVRNHHPDPETQARPY